MRSYIFSFQAHGSETLNDRLLSTHFEGLLLANTDFHIAVVVLLIVVLV